MKEILEKLSWILKIQLGLDFRRMLRALAGVPRYFADWVKFRKTCTERLEFRPCLHDWSEEGGSTKDEYFWQDLHVARTIHRRNPDKHVDIGSRIDGFVAHVASFRDIEVFDIRPISSLVPGVKFKQADLTNLSQPCVSYCDSLSCLHALEHFGLGRYGDPIDPTGYVTGLTNMARMLQAGGLLYLSVPVGKERVEFNAHRVFDPLNLVSRAADSGLRLKDFAWIAPNHALVESTDMKRDLESLRQLAYALGIFTFIKQ